MSTRNETGGGSRARGGALDGPELGAVGDDHSSGARAELGTGEPGRFSWAAFVRALFVPTCLAILIMAAFVVPLPAFVELPGEPLSLGQAVTVEAPEVEELHGDFLLTAVNLRRGTVAALLRAQLADDQSVVSERLVIPPGERDVVYFERQRAVFRESVDVAAAVGLQAAGLDVDPTAVQGSGVLVIRVLPGTPAEGLLEPGDVIVGVNGEEVRTVDDLRGMVGEADGASDAVRVITFLRADEEEEVEIVPADIPAPGGGTVRGIGVEIQTADPRIDLPVPVRVDSGRIGGPSAGLMMALTVYDKVDATVDLAAGRTIAGTGTLSPAGRVGPIGGITQKVAAAQRSGVDVFVSPAAQLEVARAALEPGTDLVIIGVATFDEAVAALLAGIDGAAAEVAAGIDGGQSSSVAVESPVASAVVPSVARRGQHRAGGW
jgi:Lon-like protease